MKSTLKNKSIYGYDSKNKMIEATEGNSQVQQNNWTQWLNTASKLIRPVSIKFYKKPHSRPLEDVEWKYGERYKHRISSSDSGIR